MSKFTKILLLLGLFITSLTFAAIPIQWQTLAPGLDFTRISFMGEPSFGKIYAFRFSLIDYRLQVGFTQNSLTTVPDLVLTNKAYIGVNGGFFTPQMKPLGLRIDQGEIKNPLKSTAWWGVFYVLNDKAYIVTQNNFKPNKAITFAVQSGPRLIVNSKIPQLKPGFANRTALGITSDGKIILVVTSNFPISTTELAGIMQRTTAEGGLNCVDAINLDGGSSTQLYAQIKDFLLHVPGYTRVSDAVLVVPKSIQ